jgi:hypothetical protein
MLEAEGKGLALRRLRDQLGGRGWGGEEGRLLPPQPSDAEVSARRKSGKRPSSKAK